MLVYLRQLAQCRQGVGAFDAVESEKAPPHAADIANVKFDADSSHLTTTQRICHTNTKYTSGENICKYTTSRVELNASRVTFQIQTKWKFFIRNVKGQLVPPGNMFVNIEITLEISMMQLNSQNVSKTFLALKRDSSPKRTFPKLDCMSNVRTLPRVVVFRVILNILVHLLGGNTV